MASMLDCNKIQPRLSEYVDGVLDGDAAWQTKLHLSSCAVCSRITEDLTATAGLLRSLPVIELSSRFESALAQRLADQALRPRRASVWSRLADWWGEAPRLRPVLATSAALAALIPAAVVVTTRVGNVAPSSVGAPVASTTATTASSSEATLEDLWQEHSVYASSEPLADPSGMLANRVASAAPTSTSGSEGSL